MTHDLATFAIDTHYHDIPDQAMYEAKYLLMDTVGCALAALSFGETLVTIRRAS